MNLTEHQAIAIHTHHKNLIVVAGAGSGKTRVLVERYLSLLDTNPTWSLNALVAITFTKKAAGEMRDRVRKSIEDHLRGANGLDFQRRWSDLLASMDSARIDTIHGLCASILRANAAEAGVDPEFAVLDETEARILLDEVVEDTLQQIILEGNPAVRLLTDYRYELKDLRAVLSNPEFLALQHSDLSSDWLVLWEAEWEQNAIHTLERFKRQAESIGSPFDPPTGDSLGDKWFFCLQCLDHLYDAADLANHFAALGEIAGIRMGGGSVKNWGDETAFDEAKSMLTEIRDAAKHAIALIGDRPGDLDQRAADIIPLWISLIQRVQTSYRDVKSARSQLDFNDLESLTCALLQTSPDVRKRYCGAEFKHLLVDEFQDTNTAQWDIICALADLHTPGSLFVVGDPKQSIYQFRGADVSVFGSVQEQITQVGGEAIPLAKSFRTHQPLVDCFNAIFGTLLARDEDSPVKDFEVILGEPMTAARETPPSNHPCLELLLVEKQDDFDSSAMRRWEAYNIAQRLQAMVDTGTTIFDKEANLHRAVRFGDMALLFQSMSQVTQYEDVFKALGLPFVTVAGRGYYSRQEVWDILNLLRALYNTADNLSLAAVLRSPMFSLSDDALYGLRLSTDQNGERLSLWSALGQSQHVPSEEISLVDFARETLHVLHRLAGRVTVAELMREALNRTGYLATLTGLPDGARRRGNVEKLLEIAQTSGRVTLGEFSQYLSDLSSLEVREGEAPLETAGAVTLMTVHASKGLEYPVVVLMDSTWTRKGGGGDPVVLHDARYGLTCKVFDENTGKHGKPFSYQRVDYLQDLREVAERKRLLYVAATRAQDYLLISGQKGKSLAGWLAWLDAALQDGILDQTATREGTVCVYKWGQVRWTKACEPPPDDLLGADQIGDSSWDKVLPIDASVAIKSPPLVGEIQVERDAPTRHLSATQIADLGGAIYADVKERHLYRDRFRRKALYDAPATIASISAHRPQQVTGRQIGEIVHEALRYWRFPGEQDNLDDLLRSYAWKHGIVSEEFREEAVGQARRLLTRFVGSDVYDGVKEARRAGRPVFTELPFIFHTDNRILHGVIDLLFQRENGDWLVVDYKTSYMSNKSAATPQQIADHARRYHLQVGVYATAVQEQLGGIVPEAHIHYIRYTHTVRVTVDEWREALANLETLIGRVVWDDDEEDV